jgi:hypothetical protein
MNTRGQLRIDPGTLELPDDEAVFQCVVVHSERSLTAAVLRRATELLSGLNAHILLVAVHTVAFPAPLAGASASHAYLVEQLVDLACQCPLPITPQVVLARYWEEGFRFLLQEESTVLVGTKKRPWRAQEEHLALTLAKDGHKVALLHVA